MRTIHKNGVALLLVLVLCSLLVGVTWFNATFTVMSTSRGDEFLILRAEQAEECKDSPGCAVFSDREFTRSVNEVLRRYQGSKGRT